MPKVLIHRIWIFSSWNDCPTPMMIRSQNNSQTSIPTKSSISTTEIRQNDTDKKQVLDKLEKIFTLKINLPERELNHYSLKLQNTISTLNQDHLSFVNKVFDEILGHDVNSNQLKSEIVEYMMHNDGVSSWCSPLKKVVSSIEK
ncbi:hypothetical protein KGF54_005144 [Candida jiufengensis]|uniref:uncharacterized protein n=1 Tax=Candida jiufengensis TaxID=497108 RepID=UPI0022244669|nr:uncharacterized protein KGF54_005144 [Candida jiufengensis]KAI5950327.1 hypothetical protein KGF54_005144 [Candida jiufengensis]